MWTNPMEQPFKLFSDFHTQMHRCMYANAAPPPTKTSIQLHTNIHVHIYCVIHMKLIEFNNRQVLTVLPAAGATSVSNIKYFLISLCHHIGVFWLTLVREGWQFYPCQGCRKVERKRKGERKPALPFIKEILIF